MKQYKVIKDSNGAIKYEYSYDINYSFVYNYIIYECHDDDKFYRVELRDDTGDENKDGWMVYNKITEEEFFSLLSKTKAICEIV